MDIWKKLSVISIFIFSIFNIIKGFGSVFATLTNHQIIFTFAVLIIFVAACIKEMKGIKEH